MYTLAGLNENQLAALQRFEEESGLKVLAFTPLPVEPAVLPADVLGRLQELEKALGVCLLAVQ